MRPSFATDSAAVRPTRFQDTGLYNVPTQAQCVHSVVTLWNMNDVVLDVFEHQFIIAHNTHTGSPLRLCAPCWIRGENLEIPNTTRAIPYRVLDLYEKNCSQNPSHLMRLDTIDTRTRTSLRTRVIAYARYSSYRRPPKRRRTSGCMFPTCKTAHILSSTIVWYTAIACCYTRCSIRTREQ